MFVEAIQASLYIGKGGGGHACSLASPDADSLTKMSIIRTERQEPPAEIQMLVIVGKLPEMLGPTV